jgi:hypothetical protein
MHKSSPSKSVLAGLKYEEDVIQFKPLLMATAGLFGLCGFAAVVCIVVIWAFVPGIFDAKAGSTAPRIVPKEALVQMDPARDIHKFRGDEKKRVDSYGWVDQTQGIARIPIESAMEMVLKEGLPTAASAATPITPVQSGLGTPYRAEVGGGGTVQPETHVTDSTLIYPAKAATGGAHEAEGSTEHTGAHE